METVEELIRRKDDMKIWLCPSLVSNGRIGNPPYLSGIECTRSTVPENLRTKEVRRFYRQGGFLCIIWENDEDCKWEGYEGLNGGV